MQLIELINNANRLVKQAEKRRHLFPQFYNDLFNHLQDLLAMYKKGMV